MELPSGKQYDKRRAAGDVCGLYCEIYGLRTSPLRLSFIWRARVISGMGIDQNHQRGTIHRSQRIYVRNLIDRFGPMPSSLTLLPVWIVRTCPCVPAAGPSHATRPSSTSLPAA